MKNIDENNNSTENEDNVMDNNIPRPKLLNDFIGQSKIKEELHIYIKAAKKEKQAMDHILFDGPPGVGKTTLSLIISNELEVGFKSISAPSITKPSDIISTLMGLEEKDVLFIDEIHRLPKIVEETLYTVMEDFKLNIIVGDFNQAKSVDIELPKFTLIGATTRAGSLSAPLKDRFGIPLNLELYSLDEMKGVIKRATNKLSIEITEEAISDIAIRARGTPRIGLRLLKRVKDFYIVMEKPKIDKEITNIAFEKIGINQNGLNQQDLKYIDIIKNKFNGGPVGINTLSSALNENQDTIEQTIEPWLIQNGYIQKTSKGRIYMEI